MATGINNNNNDVGTEKLLMRMGKSSTTHHTDQITRCKCHDKLEANFNE